MFWPLTEKKKLFNIKLNIKIIIIIKIPQF